jgi:hypothetical protein
MKTLTLMLLILPFVASCATPNKAELDDEVRRLCAVDGGVKVYETVTLSAQKFDRFGVVTVPLRKNAKPEDPYYYEWRIRYYKRGSPEMWRNHFILFRAKDQKVLGEAIGYSRRGGDVPSPKHDSSYGCPRDADISVLKQRVFRSNAAR